MQLRKRRVGLRGTNNTANKYPAKIQVFAAMDSVLSLCEVIAPDVSKQITWLQSKGLLARNKQCSSCSNPMELQHRNDISDKYRWRCPNCKKSLSLRSGTFFEQSRLQLRQWIVLMYWWAREYPVKDAAEEALVDEKTAIQIYQYCRDICSWRLLNTDAPLMLGGPGVVVQIDESLFRHKPKYHRGYATRNEVWVFGLCDTSVSPAQGLMCIVPDRRAQTLLPIIQRHVRTGSIVHSDQWRAYDRVQQLPSVSTHDTVNHSVEFVSPTGVHTQNIESYWSRVKRKFKRMKGVHESMLNSYLDEFMWRERHGRSAPTALANLCRDISLRYPPVACWHLLSSFLFIPNQLFSKLPQHKRCTFVPQIL